MFFQDLKIRVIYTETRLMDNVVKRLKISFIVSKLRSSFVATFDDDMYIYIIM